MVPDPYTHVYKEPTMAQHMNLSETQDHIRKALLDYASDNKDNYCKTFALIANFAGWKWANLEITIDSVKSIYDSLVYACENAIMGMTEDSIKGTNYTVSSGTGRINVCVTYYCNHETVLVHITTITN